MKTPAQPEPDQQPRCPAPAERATQQRQGLAIADSRVLTSAERRLRGAIHNSPRIVAQRAQLNRMFGEAAQLKGGPEEEEPLQGKFEALQWKGPKEEELLQGKFIPVQQKRSDEELLQSQFAGKEDGVVINDNHGSEKDTHATVNPLGSLLVKSTAAPTSIVQHKKTTKPADKELLDKFTVGHKLPSAVLSGKVSDPDKGDAIWAHLTTTYNTNKDNGQRYWAELTKAITDYKDVDKKATVVSGNTAKRSGYDSRFGANYSNTVEGLGGTTYRVNTEGYDPPSVKPAVPTGKYKGNYSNEFDVAGGNIKAAWNFGASKDRDTGVVSYDDKALEAGKGLNNSEILWQQYQLAASQHFSGDPDQAGKVQQALKNITTIQRDTVINDETQETVYMAYPDGKQWGDEDKVWRPAQEEFMAVLGTPNARSSPHFLKDHLDQLEKTIDKITTTAAEGIDIDFTPI